MPSSDWHSYAFQRFWLQDYLCFAAKKFCVSDMLPKRAAQPKPEAGSCSVWCQVWNFFVVQTNIQPGCRKREPPWHWLARDFSPAKSRSLQEWIQCLHCVERWPIAILFRKLQASTSTNGAGSGHLACCKYCSIAHARKMGQSQSPRANLETAIFEEDSEVTSEGGPRTNRLLACLPCCHVS